MSKSRLRATLGPCSARRFGELPACLCTALVVWLMQFAMLAASQGDQVLRTVVVSNPIDVMPAFVRQQKATERRLKHDSVLGNIAPHSFRLYGAWMFWVVDVDVAKCALSSADEEFIVRACRHRLMSRHEESRQADIETTRDRCIRGDWRGLATPAEAHAGMDTRRRGALPHFRSQRVLSCDWRSELMARNEAQWSSMLDLSGERSATPALANSRRAEFAVRRCISFLPASVVSVDVEPRVALEAIRARAVRFGNGCLLAASTETKAVSGITRRRWRNSFRHDVTIVADNKIGTVPLVKIF